MGSAETAHGGHRLAGLVLLLVAESVALSGCAWVVRGSAGLVRGQLGSSVVDVALEVAAEGRVVANVDRGVGFPGKQDANNDARRVSYGVTRTSGRGEKRRERTDLTTFMTSMSLGT